MVARRNHRVLWLALLAILLITGVYLLATNWLGAVPPSSDMFGHLIGVAGFILMLMTEILYSLRKRSRSARWGRMSAWLDFHIFTGIVGPYMVLLHSAWNFKGLAGFSMLLTVLIVVSGFIGRYIYTAIPRTVDGAEIEAGLLESQVASLAAMRRWLGLWHSIHIPIGWVLFTTAFIHSAAALYYATFMR